MLFPTLFIFFYSEIVNLIWQEMRDAAVGALSVCSVFIKWKWGTKVCVSPIQRIGGGGRGWCYAGNVVELESWLLMAVPDMQDLWRITSSNIFSSPVDSMGVYLFQLTFHTWCHIRLHWSKVCLKGKTRSWKGYYREWVVLGYFCLQKPSSTSLKIENTLSGINIWPVVAIQLCKTAY